MSNVNSQALPDAHAHAEGEPKDNLAESSLPSWAWGR